MSSQRREETKICTAVFRFLHDGLLETSERLAELAANKLLRRRKPIRGPSPAPVENTTSIMHECDLSIALSCLIACSSD